MRGIKIPQYEFALKPAVSVLHCNCSLSSRSFKSMCMVSRCRGLLSILGALEWLPEGSSHMGSGGSGIFVNSCQSIKTSKHLWHMATAGGWGCFGLHLICNWYRNA